MILPFKIMSSLFSLKKSSAELKKILANGQVGVYILMFSDSSNLLLSSFCVYKLNKQIKSLCVSSCHK